MARPLLALLALLATAAPAVYRQPPSNSQEHAGLCFSRELGVTLQPGAAAPLPGRCGMANCDRDLTLHVRTCGVVRPPPGCRLLKRSELIYPACCPQPHC